MAERSELAHRLLELKTAMMGRLVPKVLSRKTDGIDGIAKKLAAKGAGASTGDNEGEAEVDPDLVHPDDVPEIVTGHERAH